MIKIDVISGFLGSGKTTLIKKMLDCIKDENVVVIENEFGQIGIDGELIKKEGLQVLELQNGCICCSIKLNFKDTLLDVINKFKPDRIIIEPTGIGLLSEIITMINNLDKDMNISINSLITVIDGVNYFDYIDNFGDFFEDQIENASVLIISKSQFIDNQDLDDIIKSLKHINKTTNILYGDWDGRSFCNIFEILSMVNKKDSLDFNNMKKKDVNENMKNISSISIIPKQSYSVENLEIALIKLNEIKFGKIIRCKGFVNSEESLLEFSYINGNYTIKESNINTTPKICTIGSNLKSEDIKNIFK